MGSRIRSLIALLAVAVPVVAASGTATAAPAAPGTGPSATAWPQYGGSARHQDANPFEHTFTTQNVSSLRVAWRGVYGSNATDESSPVVANGIAYIAGFDGRVSAFDVSGCGAGVCHPLWQGQTNNDITATPAVARGTLLVASADHFLYAFAAAGCGVALCPPLWKGTLGGADVDSSVAVAGGMAFVGTYNDGRLYAFAIGGCGAAVCPPVWMGLAGGHLVSSPAVGRGSVFVGSDDDHMYVFPANGCGATTCEPTWTADIGGPAYTVSPVIVGSTVFMGSGKNFGGIDHNAHLLVFDADGCGSSECRPTRVYDTGDAGIIGTPAVSGGTVFVSTQSTPDLSTVGVVAAYPAHGCGAFRCLPTWTGINFGSGSESSPVVANGVVFVAKGPASGFPVDAGLYAFDAAGCGTPTCQPLVFVQAGPDQFYLGSSPAVAGGQVMFGSGDNTDQTSDLYVISLPG